LASGCSFFGSLSKMLAVLCTQQRWCAQPGETFSRAGQKPSAPSATASFGGCLRPRRFKSRNNPNHDSSLCYHVINRGNDRWDLFAAGGGGEAFERVLGEAAERFG